ncbi:MAG: adenylyltransferase/cytidyltransferase family protein [Candidatus Abawacabacteria bacterium]|nr:adenylyltransferase/cytidyltransferase family protein [Candidatus Abawacabacteria bacterium]
MAANKIILDLDQLRELIEVHKIQKKRIVCTIGSWDMLHIGHLRYLNRARSCGDLLVVGADSDRGIKIYKNPLRPIIPQEERLEMLSYQDCVDYATLIDDIDDQGKWQYELIKTIQPDVFVCITESYPEQQRKEIKQYVTELVELPRQAENTSTTKIIEKAIKTHLAELKAMVEGK